MSATHQRELTEHGYDFVQSIDEYEIYKNFGRYHVLVPTTGSFWAWDLESLDAAKSVCDSLLAEARK